MPSEEQPERILEDSDGFHCICGNDEGDIGFSPCLSTGEVIEPLQNGPWDGRLYCCMNCDRIIDQDTLRVVGRSVLETITYDPEQRDFFCGSHARRPGFSPCLRTGELLSPARQPDPDTLLRRCLECGRIINEVGQVVARVPWQGVSTSSNAA